MHEASSPPEAMPQGLINKRTAFLVVDDFEPMRKVTLGQLRTMGATNVMTANNGAEALRMLKNHRVDIVLSDWHMPVMSGLDLLRAMRADNKTARLPFIMITAESERQRIEEAIASGVSDLLVKPYTADRLVTHIEKVLSAPNRRSSFSRAIAPVAEMNAEAGTPSTQQRPRILVVDDTPDNLQLIAHLFKDEYRVRIAHTGAKALAICQSDTPPDLVLLDIMMPGMDGFEVAQKMREHPTSATIPVIFITAMTGDDARLRGMELGAVDFVTKPIDPNALKLRVRNFMRYVALHKQLQASYDSMLEVARLREDVESITRHDLKGPLAGLIGLVQALADDNSTNRRQFGKLHIIEETAIQVLDMINLSAELFKIETGRFKLDAQPIRIGDILRRIVEMARMTFAEKRIVIAVDTDVPVGEEVPQALGDAMFCYSLFQNLIRNACEAAPSRSRVAVTLTSGASMHIKIRNTGAVPAGIRESFFEKFVTLGKVGGSGLGTYSAKLLTEAQNGSISLDVADAENLTTITVALPRYAGSTPFGVSPAPTFKESPRLSPP